MSDDLHPLRDKENDSLVRLLSNRVRGLCGGVGDLSKTAKSSAGRASVPTDAPGQAGQGGDIGSSESGGVKP